MTVLAEAGEPKAEENVYSDTGQFPYVDDIDEYLAQLNAELITPSNSTTITTYEPTVTPFSTISDPSKSCSNIFGHKWSAWGSWEEVDRYHYSSVGACKATIERWRFCERTHCGASQKETDSAWVSCTH